jgi:hypothetical protein
MKLDKSSPRIRIGQPPTISPHPTMRLLLTCIALLFTTSLRANDAAIAAALKSKGAEITETKGVITGLSFRDCTKFTDADFAQVRQLTQLKLLSLGAGCNDHTLIALGALPELENLSTNGLDATDEGIRVLTACKKLKSFALFHPGKNFTGTGLAALAQMPALESLTVGGSSQFADAGMAAVATLKGLKGFRTWHTGVTLEGVKHLTALKNLTSLTLGQRLSNTPPTTLADDCLPILATLTSLESLNLNEARLSLPAITQLKNLPKLKRLNLDAIDISDTDLTALKKELPKTDIRWAAPKDSEKKRIDALFGTAKK